LTTDFDYIIAGGGCAGLSLAYCLSKSTLSYKKILIIDKEIKAHNDRTWCFWTHETTPFDAIVFRSWENIEFLTENYQEIYPLKKLRYKIIRGIDFYAEVKRQLAKFPNIIWLQDEILEVEENPDQVSIKTLTHSYSGTWLFDSRLSSQVYQSATRTLLQHFKGYVINTPTPIFDTSKVTMFDFRLPQNDEVRFVYTLPYSEKQALIEFTVFGKKLYQQEKDYTEILKNYLEKTLQIKDYEIIEEEFGVIPMTDFAFSSKKGQRIKNIGILGGNSKPSTGYTFLNIQRDSVKTVQSLAQTGQPFYHQEIAPQFKLYDKMILDIMLRDGGSIKEIFTQMFRNNAIDTILYFLDNQTHFGKDLTIMASVPPLPFLKSLVNIAKKR
jgi:lycopene beta-cyclase